LNEHFQTSSQRINLDKRGFRVKVEKMMNQGKLHGSKNVKTRGQKNEIASHELSNK